MSEEKKEDDSEEAKGSDEISDEPESTKEHNKQDDSHEEETKTRPNEGGEVNDPDKIKERAEDIEKAKVEAKQNSNEEENEGAKEEQNAELKEEPKEESKDEPKKEVKEEVQEEPKEGSKEEPEEEPKDEPKEEHKGEHEEKQNEELKEEAKEENPIKEESVDKRENSEEGENEQLNKEEAKSEEGRPTPEERKESSETPKEETKELSSEGRDSDTNSEKRQSDNEEAKCSEERPLTIVRRNSKFELQKGSPMYRPEFIYNKNESEKDVKMWDLMKSYLGSDIQSIQRQIVNHVEYTCARNRFTFNNYACYYATAYSVRDRLVESWNDTQQHIYEQDPKSVYFMSMEYLLGKQLQSALMSIGQEVNFREALGDMGYDLNEVYEEENDPGLGNAGIGRLAACFLDSLATLEYPAWGYGMRYSYGGFKQEIRNGCQFEMPDYWLARGNPWEIERLDVGYKVHFYGKVKTYMEDGIERKDWEGEENVLAMAYDIPIPGYNAFNTNNLRLWKACPSSEFDFKSFNTGDYFGAVRAKQRAESITSVLYPNDTTMEGKELRLRQEYFFCAATLADILGRFTWKHNNWHDFPKKVAIHLNGSNPGLVIVEMMRQLVDKYKVPWEQSWKICCQTCSYTNHIGIAENLEKWDISLIGKLLPRHLEIIYLINYYFLEEIRKVCDDSDTIRSLSLIEESCPKKVKLVNLCTLASHKVNGVSQLHTKVLREIPFKNLIKYCKEPKDKFINITNGITPRRWLLCSNPQLANLITKKIGHDEWITNLFLIKDLKAYADDEEVINEFIEIRKQNKIRLIEWVKKNCNGIVVNPNTLFDVLVKEVTESKRHLMAALYVAYRYIWIKNMQADERANIVPRTFFFGGKACPGNIITKNIIKFINVIATKVNEDEDVKELMKVVYLPNYSVSNAQLIIPAADIFQHISTAGTEACGTTSMKFVMNGCLLLAAMTGSTAEVIEELGKENMFLFGGNAEEVEEYREQMQNGKRDYIPQALFNVLSTLRAGYFGKMDELGDLLNRLENGQDHYAICWDFTSYVEAQTTIDECYKDQKEWMRKAITSIACSGKFSSDRTIKEYADKVW